MFTYNPVPKPGHKRKAPKRGDRNKFPSAVRDKLKEHFNNTCQICGSRACHIHHVKFRSEGGRGVFTNGLLLCNSCHKKVHLNNELAQYWRDQFKKIHGPLYFMDEEDLRFKALNDALEKENRLPFEDELEEVNKIPFKH